MLTLSVDEKPSTKSETALRRPQEGGVGIALAAERRPLLQIDLRLR